MPFLFTLVSSRRITDLSFLLESGLEEKYDSNLRIHCLTASFVTPNRLPMAARERTSIETGRFSLASTGNVMALDILLSFVARRNSSFVFSSPNECGGCLLAISVPLS